MNLNYKYYSINLVVIENKKIQAGRLILAVDFADFARSLARLGRIN